MAGDAVLEELERNAPEAKIGLWADPQPVPPWSTANTNRTGTRLVGNGSYRLATEQSTMAVNAAINPVKIGWVSMRPLLIIFRSFF